MALAESGVRFLSLPYEVPSADEGEAPEEPLPEDAGTSMPDGTPPVTPPVDLPPATGAENTQALCKDGQDNDGDGLVDCADQDCGYFKFCVKAKPASAGAENTPAKCKDGKDNDGDGLADCADQDCALLSFCSK